LQGFCDWFFLFELNITNTLGSLTDAILYNLGLVDWSNPLEELLELTSPETCGKLLNENSATIAFVFVELGRGLSISLTFTTTVLSSASSVLLGEAVRAITSVSVITIITSVASVVRRTGAWATSVAPIVVAVSLASVSPVPIAVAAAAPTSTLVAAGIASRGSFVGGAATAAGAVVSAVTITAAAVGFSVMVARVSAALAILITAGRGAIAILHYDILIAGFGSALRGGVEQRLYIIQAGHGDLGSKAIG
jgi:hypothetical protein